MGTTTLHQTRGRARLVSSRVLPTVGSWPRDGITALGLGTTGLPAYMAAGTEGIRGNCQVDAFKRSTTRPSRHLATGST